MPSCCVAAKRKQRRKVQKSRKVTVESGETLQRFDGLTFVMAEMPSNMSHVIAAELLQNLMSVNVVVGSSESTRQEVQCAIRWVGKINKLSRRAVAMLIRARRHGTTAIGASTDKTSSTMAKPFVRIVRQVKAIKSSRDHNLTTNVIRNAKRLQACYGCITMQQKMKPTTTRGIRGATLFDNRCQTLNGTESNARPQRWQLEKPQLSKMREGMENYKEGQGAKTKNVEQLNAQNTLKVERQGRLSVASESNGGIKGDCSQGELKNHTLNAPEIKFHLPGCKTHERVGQLTAHTIFKTPTKLQVQQPTRQHPRTFTPIKLQGLCHIEQQPTQYQNSLESITQLYLPAQQPLFRSQFNHKSQLICQGQSKTCTDEHFLTQTATQTQKAIQKRPQIFVVTRSELGNQGGSKAETVFSKQLQSPSNSEIRQQRSKPITRDQQKVLQRNQPEKWSELNSSPSNNHSSIAFFDGSLQAKQQNLDNNQRKSAPSRRITEMPTQTRTRVEDRSVGNLRRNLLNHIPHPTKTFSDVQLFYALLDWRAWLYRTPPQARFCPSPAPRTPTRGIISSQIHLTDLCAGISPLLLLSMVLFLLTTLPFANAACRDEPARPCEAICTPDAENCTLRALLLLPDDDSYLASMRRSLPVMHLAEQYIREHSLLPRQLQWEWMTGDVKCDAAYATIKAMDGIVKNCAHVVFGPVCDYALAAVSRIAKYFNHNGTPVISIGGATDNFELKKTSCADEFYMLLRSGLLSFKSISLMIIELLKRYNWSNSILFYEQNGQNDVAGEHSCYLMMKSFGNEMRDLNQTFAQYSIMPELQNRTEELKREIGNKHASKCHLTSFLCFSN